MTHVLSRFGPTDNIWIRGMMCIVQLTGGGRIVKRRRQVGVTHDVEVNRPTIFLRMISDVSNVSNLETERKKQ